MGEGVRDHEELLTASGIRGASLPDHKILLDQLLASLSDEDASYRFSCRERGSSQQHWRPRKFQ
jgi:hypothetical protein